MTTFVPMYWVPAILVYARHTKPVLTTQPRTDDWRALERTINPWLTEKGQSRALWFELRNTDIAAVTAFIQMLREAYPGVRASDEEDLAALLEAVGP